MLVSGSRRHATLLLGLVAAIFSPPSVARAQGPPIQTDTPIMLGLAGRGVRTFLKVVRKETLLQDGNAITDPMDRSVTAYVSPLAVPYNLTTTFQIGTVVPFVTKTLDSNVDGKTRSGIGDISLFAKKLLVQVDRKGETFRVAAKATTVLPTGDDDVPVPLGSGAFGYGGSIVAGWIKGRWGLYGEAIYIHNTSNGDIDYGDRVGYNAALAFRLLPAVYERYPSPQLNLFLELNGNTFGRAEVTGVENPDSGGSELFLSPGIQFVGGRIWLVEASVQIPVRDQPNGTQLGTDWTASTGLRVLLF